MTSIGSGPAPADLKGALVRSRNRDGGWGYYRGKTSRLEPTCWALLALGESGDGEVLRQWPSAEGLLLERAGGQPNYAFHGLAVTTLLHWNLEHTSGNQTLVSGLARVKGIALKQDETFRQNNSLQAWSWIDSTFSWVEPTACCLLALKQAARKGLSADAKRIADGEALLFDRCCVTGGWNYGNANSFGQNLVAYVPTTALALLALQDRPAERAFLLSREYLRREALSEPSAVALSLAIVSLRELGTPVGEVLAALRRQLPTTLALGHQQAIAMALYALRTDHGDAAFRL